MPIPALPTLAALAAFLTAPTPDLVWRPLLAYDEVTVEMERSSVYGDGPFTVQLRWTYRDRAVSPRAWDAGVRSSIDLVEIDCQAGASRTWITSAFAGDGRAVPEMSAEHERVEWERHAEESMGGLLVREGCALLSRGR